MLPYFAHTLPFAFRSTPLHTVFLFDRARLARSSLEPTRIGRQEGATPSRSVHGSVHLAGAKQETQSRHRGSGETGRKRRAGPELMHTLADLACKLPSFYVLSYFVECETDDDSCGLKLLVATVPAHLQSSGTGGRAVRNTAAAEGLARVSIENSVRLLCKSLSLIENWRTRASKKISQLSNLIAHARTR
jgi:hypothetical protein